MPSWENKTVDEMTDEEREEFNDAMDAMHADEFGTSDGDEYQAHNLVQCIHCDGNFEPEQLNSEGSCDRCYGEEWMDCDECGCHFMRNESSSEDTCSDCLLDPDPDPDDD